MIALQVSFIGQGKAASDSWANEFQQYGWADVKLTAAVFNTGIGHATQVWALVSIFLSFGAWKWRELDENYRWLGQSQPRSDAEWLCARMETVSSLHASTETSQLSNFFNISSSSLYFFFDKNCHFQGQYAQPERLSTQGLIVGCLDLHSPSR